MASQLQNRLVGTVILVALAVIILPDLLDGKKQQQQQDYETIPLQPQTEVTRQQAQMPDTERVQEPESRQLNLAITAEAAPEVSAEDAQAFAGNAEPREAQTQDAEVDKEAWVIQLGVFRNADSVERLVQRLQQEGYKAYAEKVTTDTGVLTKLMVGPSSAKSSLEQELVQLNEMTKLQGKVLQYQP